MTKLPFLERLSASRPILADGAMGTQLHRGGAPMHSSFDALNLNEPEAVAAIHRAYVQAGSELIETNTWGANRLKLSPYGYGDQVEAVNRAGVEIVKKVLLALGHEDTVYIAGSVGPLGVRLRPYGKLSAEEARGYFAEQITALAEAGVDVLLFETFADHSELLEALAAARQVAPGLPIICQTTFASDGHTLPGHTPAKVAYDLHKAGADVIGEDRAAPGGGK